MTQDDLIKLLGAVGIGSILIAVATLLKLRPERTKILIESAGAVVVMQNSLIDDLNEKIQILEAENTMLRKRLRNMEKMVQDLDLRTTTIEERSKEHQHEYQDLDHCTATIEERNKEQDLK